MNTFARKIKTLRLTKGLSQGELGDRLNTAGVNVHLWEKGRLPHARNILRLANALGIEPSELAELWMADYLATRKEG